MWCTGAYPEPEDLEFYILLFVFSTCPESSQYYNKFSSSQKWLDHFNGLDLLVSNTTGAW